MCRDGYKAPCSTPDCTSSTTCRDYVCCLACRDDDGEDPSDDWTAYRGTAECRSRELHDHHAWDGRSQKGGTTWLYCPGTFAKPSIEQVEEYLR